MKTSSFHGKRAGGSGGMPVRAYGVGPVDLDIELDGVGGRDGTAAEPVPRRAASYTARREGSPRTR